MPRYECDDPEFAGNFIEYSDAWSLREVNALVAAPLAETIGIAGRKVTALHLETVEGEPLVAPIDFNDAMLEEVDLRLYYWVAGTFSKIATDVGKLGEALRRRLFVSAVETIDGAPPPAS